MRIELVGHPEHELLIQNGLIQLEELRSYRLIFGSGERPKRVRLGERELTWKSDISGFELDISYWAASSVLSIEHDETHHTVQVEVRPREEKLAETAWEQLLCDLETWLPASTLGQSGGKHGEVGLSGASAPSLALALLPLVPSFIRAIKAVLGTPRERAISQESEEPAHRVRRADRNAVRWLVRQPEAWQYLTGEAPPDSREPLIPQEITELQLDHPANRYVAWLVRWVARHLEDIAHVLEKQSTKRASPDGDVERWCADRAALLREYVTELDRLRRRSFLGRLPAEPPSEAALLTIVDDPLYARVHALGRRFRSAHFQLPKGTGEYPAPLRPSYELYELWTFLALRQFLPSVFPGASWISKGLDTILIAAGTGAGALFTADLPQKGTLQLLFNPTFAGYLSRGKAERWSLSRERRPDIVLTWKPREGATRWLCLDAKYRVEPEAVADAFTSAHVYHDALRWPSFGDRCQAAALLVPAKLTPCAPWFERAFLDANGIGVWQLTPGRSNVEELLAWIAHSLTHE